MNPIRTQQSNSGIRALLTLTAGCLIHATGAQAATLANAPLFVKASQPPLVMLTMARDHKLYYEAYNDYSDLNGDGSLDVGYKPGAIEYYGHFDSYKCYAYAGGLFTPVAMSGALGTTPETYNKKCTGSPGTWSGDFLNYVTTSRIDALRKVLYGGFRSTDTTTQTIVERAFIPQDAHSWGKEYHSVANDGYDISEYTPLALPVTGRRHLFANVTLTGYGQPPLMRVLENSTFRIWNWVSIERPVAGTQCATGNNLRSNCDGSAPYTGTPANAGAYQTLIDTYATSGRLTNFRDVAQINQSGTNLNPYQPDPDNYYLDVFRGNLNITTAGSYQFSVDGDDAVELWIDGNLLTGWYGGHGMCNCDTHVGTVNLTAGSHTIEFRHQEAGGGEGWKLGWNGPDSGNSWAIVPAAAFSNLRQSFYNTDSVGTATMTDYTVRTEVCKEITGLPNNGREANCKAYTDGTTTIYKPTGVLHKYGDNNGMYFGLLTGSYDQNTDGGILRKPMSSITNEIETTTGIFKESGSTCGSASSSTCVAGIVGTINRLHITSFNYGSYAYSCGWITTRAMNPGECEMWGNPLAEMIYESVRYFSGATSATAAFTTSSTRDDGVTLPGGGTGLPRFTTWTNPYTATPTVPIPDTGPFPNCSKPFLMLISDVYPSFDSDKVPGTFFGSIAATTINNAALDVSSRSQELWNLEFGASASKNIFIGQVGTNEDGAPTAKNASSFGNIRGLAPSDPTRQGSYYSASIANFGHLNNLNPAFGTTSKLPMGTFSIALAAPLPTIQVPIPGSPDKPVTIVPFAKSPGGSGISATQGDFQPTNQIVDFYVDVIRNTVDDVVHKHGNVLVAGNKDANVNGGRPYYLFRINYEDVEQGADHDMDAIALYEIKLNADNTISVKVDSIYAAGGIIQHMGYVISGTTADGIYLVVRDTDTAYSSDPEYFLDRPNSSDAPVDSTLHLPVRSSADPDVTDDSKNFATRTFTPNTTGTSATILHNPLWYAAKYGNFNDGDGDGVPDDEVLGVDPNTGNPVVTSPSEWDSDGDKVPDSYFLVVNPLRLLRQLDDALGKIKETSGTAAATTANSFTLQADTQIFVGRFNSDGWSGELIAYPVTATEISAAKWQAQIVMKDADKRAILTYDPDQAAGSRGIPFQWSSMSSGSGAVLRDSLNRLSTGTVDGLGDKRVDFLRGVDVTGMRTRPQIMLTNIASSDCKGSYSCPSGGGVAFCSDAGSVTCTPYGKPNLLGDIINSQAQYIARPNGGFGDASYAKFAADYDGTTNPTGKGDRKAMIYVGANDGMLHGFDATTGVELLAYVPSDVYRLRNSRWGLSKLTEADYGKTGSPNEHRYYVDGTPTIGDICTDKDVGSCPDGKWRTLLVGALGAGGQGIFALDVTDPKTFSEANASTLVKWEFSDKDDPDMGYTIGRPYIVRLCTTRTDGSCDKWTWYVLINGGYNNTEADGYPSATGDAALFVIDANTGALVTKINVKQGDMTATGPNALAEIAPVDYDGDGIVDYVYAGDIKGNLWRFDFTQNPSAWETSGNPALLYVAWDEQSTRARQPITTAPDAIRHPNGGVLLNFGTGSYLFKDDDLTTQVQTVYGIWDKLNATSVASTDRLNLQQQQVITAEVTVTSTFTFGGVAKTETTDYRTVTDNPIDWATKDGWYFNLPDSRERISNNVEVRGGTILRVVSTVPSSDICAAGGYSWEYFVDAFNGGRLDWSAYPDVSGLQSFGGTNAYASARKSTTGITPPGVIITNPKGPDVEFDFGSAGQTIVKKDLGKGKAGRLGWREILAD